MKFVNYKLLINWFICKLNVVFREIRWTLIRRGKDFKKICRIGTRRIIFTKKNIYAFRRKPLLTVSPS